MEGGSIVISRSAEGEEVLERVRPSLELVGERGARGMGEGSSHLCRLGDALAKNLNLDVAMRGM